MIHTIKNMSRSALALGLAALFSFFALFAFNVPSANAECFQVVLQTQTSWEYTEWFEIEQESAEWFLGFLIASDSKYIGGHINESSCNTHYPKAANK